MIYSKHLNDYAAPNQQRREQEIENERMRDERRKLMTQQMIEQQRMAQEEVRNQYKGVLQNQMQATEDKRQMQQQERLALQNQALQKQELLRNQDEQMRQIRAHQQAEYRQILQDQKNNYDASVPIRLGKPDAGSIKVGSPQQLTYSGRY